MNIVALIVAVVTALASIGVAAWTWQAMTGAGDDVNSLAGVNGLHFED